MAWRHRGVDGAVIALWLGHESMETTQMSLHARLERKRQALEKSTPVNAALVAIDRMTTCEPASKASHNVERNGLPGERFPGFTKRLSMNRDSRLWR
jgi:hypothetical protein